MKSVLFFLFLLSPLLAWTQTQLTIGGVNEDAVVCPNPRIKVTGSGGNASNYAWFCTSCTFQDADGNSLGTGASGVSEIWVVGSGGVTINLSGASNTIAGFRHFFIATASNPSPKRLGYQYAGGTADPAPANHIGTIPYDASSFTLLIPAADLNRGDGTPFTAYQYLVQLPQGWSIYGQQGTVSIPGSSTPFTVPVVTSTQAPTGTISYKLVACQNATASNNTSTPVDYLEIRRALPPVTITGLPPKLDCAPGTVLTLSTNAFPNASYTWDVPTGWTYTQSGNTITATRTLNSVGTFSVQVSATSPYGTYQASAQQTLDWNRDLSLAVAGQSVAPYVLCGGGTEVTLVTDRSDLESYQWTASGLTLSTNNKVFTVASPAPGSNGENNGWIQVNAVSSCGYASTARLDNLLRGLPPLPSPLLTVDKSDIISNNNGAATDRAYAYGPQLPYLATYEWSSTPADQIDVQSYGLNDRQAVVNPYIDPNNPNAFPVYGYPLIQLTVGTPCGNFDATVQVHVHCAGCRVRPNPAIGQPGNGTLEVALGDSANQSLPFEGSYAELYDAREALVGKGDFDASGKAQITLNNIKSAAYTLKAYTNDGRQFEQEWIVAPDSNSRLVLSPNPAVVNIDKELEGVVFGLSDSLAPYKVTLSSSTGQQLYQTQNADTHFTIPTTTLEPGTYRVTVQGKNGSNWQDSVEVVLNSAPHLAVSPNPTSSSSWCTLENYLQGMKDLTLLLVDNMGNTRWQGTGDAEGFTLHMETLPAGLYQLVANDGMHNYTLLVRKE